MPLYKQIFTDALAVLKRFRWLWIFGLLALLFSGSVEGDIYYNFLNPEKNSVYDLATRFNNGLFNKEVLLSLPTNLTNSAAAAGSLWFTALAVLLVVIIVLVLSIGSHLLIIDQAVNLIKSPKSNQTSLKTTILSSFTKIKTTILKALAANVILKLVVMLAFLLISSPILLNTHFPQTIIDFLYLSLFVLIIPLVILGSAFLRYLMIGLVVNQFGFKQALVDSWSLFNRHKLLSLEFSVVTFIFSVILVFLTLLVISGLSIILFFFALAAQNFSYQAYVGLIAVSYLLMFAIFIGSNALISGFVISAWTSLYLQLTKKNQVSNNNQGLLNSISNKLD